MPKFYVLQHLFSLECLGLKSAFCKVKLPYLTSCYGGLVKQMSSNRASLNFSKPYSIHQNINILPTVDSRLRVLAVNNNQYVCVFLFFFCGVQWLFMKTRSQKYFYTQKAIKVCGFKKLLGRLRIRKTSKGKIICREMMFQSNELLSTV